MESKTGTIKFISKSDKNNSFHIDGDPANVWFQMPEDVKVEESFRVGDTVNFKFEMQGASRMVGQVTSVMPGTSPPEKKGFMDDYTNFEELLDKAHKRFNKGKSSLHIRTELKEHDSEKKSALFKAVIYVNNGDQSQIYEAHGDANQENCQSAMIRPHYLRMAETRAIARALRWATNTAKTAEEEK